MKNQQLIVDKMYNKEHKLVVRTGVHPNSQSRPRKAGDAAAVAVSIYLISHGVQERERRAHHVLRLRHPWRLRHLRKRACLAWERSSARAVSEAEAAMVTARALLRRPARRRRRREVVGPRRGRRKPWPASWSPPASVCSRCPKLMGLKLMGLVGLLSKLRWPIAHRGEPFMKEISSSEVS